MFLLNDKGRNKTQYSAYCAVDNKTVIKASVYNVSSRLSELHSLNKAHSTNLCNKGRICFLQLLKSLPEVCSNFFNMLKKSVINDCIQNDICSCTCKRISSKGGAMVSRLKCFGYLVACDKCSNGNTASQALCKSYNIRLNAVLLIGEELAGSAHAALNLIKNQQSIVLVTESTYLLEILLIRNMYSTLALYGFQHNCSGFFTHHALKGLYVVVVNIVKALRQWTEALVVMWLSCCCKCGNGSAMEAHVC